MHSFIINNLGTGQFWHMPLCIYTIHI